MLWGLSPHSLRGDPGHCSTLPPRFAGSGFREPRVPGTRVRGKVPGTQGSANQGPPRFAGSGNQGSGNQDSGQGSGNPRFREPGFEQGWVLASFWVPGRQGSGFPRFSDKVPGTLGCRTMASSSQSLDCAKVLESPEHQFWNILETQSLGNQGSGKVLATLGSDKVPGTTAAADPEFGYTPWIMP